MAKKKNTKKKRSSAKRGSSKKGGMDNFVDVQKLIGMAAGAFGNTMIKKIPGTGKLNPKILAAAKIIGGQWLPKQSFAQGIGSPELRQGIGDALIYEGVKDLMSGFGISGLRNTRPRGNEYLALSIEGLDDPMNVNDDILADDYDIGESILAGDDLDAVNEDIVNEDILGDDMDGDDLSTVNDDMDGDDMDGDDDDM